MARRRIGQEQLAVGSAAGRRCGTSLDEVAALIDWPEPDTCLAASRPLPKASRVGRHWRCCAPCCSRFGTTCRTCAWPRRWMTGPASAGSLATVAPLAANWRGFGGRSGTRELPEANSRRTCLDAYLPVVGLDHLKHVSGTMRHHAYATQVPHAVVKDASTA